MEKKDLKPAGVFRYFEEICQVPRPSKHEEKMVAFLKAFGEKHGLETKADEAGNVLMRKPATPGMENRKTVVLQSHVDMVCEKNNDVTHDFMNDPIETYIHGPIECLFTIDEETGLTGAFALQEGFFSGDILLNLDSEDEGELFIGCAGGVDTVAEFSYREVDVPQGYFCCRVQVKGLKGGHSGGDIHLGHANANKLLTRFLTQCADKYDLYLCQIDGGNLRNAIPREAHALIALPEADKHALRTDLNIFAAEVQDEYHVTDPDMELTLESEPFHPRAIDRDTAQRLLQALYACPHGVYAMSQDIPGLVETSTNLASVKMRPGNVIRIETSQRSSTASAKQDIARMVRTVFRMAGATVTFGEGYPGWKPNTHSEILEVATESYRRLFGTEAKVKAIHAGLECGLFLDKYPALDMLSFGPTLQGVHSPDERMLIPSVQRFWDHLVDILKHTPLKK